MFLVVDKYDFGDWLADELNKRGWSQSDFSRKSGVHRAIISKVISKTSVPQPETVEAIADGLKLPQEEVFRAAGLLKPKKSDARAERLLYQIEQLDEDDQETIETFVGALLEKRHKKNTVTKPATP